MEIESQDIIIDGISFSPVGSEEDLENIRQGIKLSNNPDDAVTNLFKGYVHYIYNQNNEKMYSVDFIDSDSAAYPIKDNLKASLAYDLTIDNDLQNFKSLAKTLADQLIRQMKSSTNPKSGILFVLKTKIKNENYIFILKVDLAKEIIQIWIDEEHLNLNVDSVKNAMPTPDKLQKGAIYPHPILDKDLKVLQETHRASYFDQFLQCKRELTEFNQFKQVPEILSTISNELGTNDEIIYTEADTEATLTDYFSESDQESLFTIENLIDCAKKIVPEANEEAIEEIVSRELNTKEIEDIYIESNATLKYKKEITIDDIKIRGPFKSIVEKVEINEGDGNTYSLIVRGTTKPRIKTIK